MKSPGRPFPNGFNKKGEAKRKRAQKRKTADMGRERKIMGFPSEEIKDCRKAVSNIGPNTTARTIEAGS
jgi:ribosomal protein S8E